MSRGHVPGGKNARMGREHIPVERHTASLQFYLFQSDQVTLETLYNIVVVSYPMSEV
jgi:hypothetical protein